MLKKTITYKDLDGNDVVEDFYFNLSKAEIAELEMTWPGGFSGHLQKIVAEEDPGKIILAFKDIIRKSIGRRSEDGKRFIKNEEIAEDFFQSDAWSALFMDLLEGQGAGAAQFVQGILPSDMDDMIAKAQVENVELPEDTRPAYQIEDREPTTRELAEMSKEELAQAFKWRQTRSQ